MKKLKKALSGIGLYTAIFPFSLMDTTVPAERTTVESRENIENLYDDTKYYGRAFHVCQVRSIL